MACAEWGHFRVLWQTCLRPPPGLWCKADAGATSLFSCRDSNSAAPSSLRIIERDVGDAFSVVSAASAQGAGQMCVE